MEHRYYGGAEPKRRGRGDQRCQVVEEGVTAKAEDEEAEGEAAEVGSRRV